MENLNCQDKIHKINNITISKIVNCVWGVWKSWESCSKNCGGGQQVRTRSKMKHASNGGIDCLGQGAENQACNTNKCEAPKCCLLGIFCGVMGKCLG